MVTITRVDSLKTWLEAKPYWEQYLWKLHLEKDDLEEADIDKCYRYLLEDSEVFKTAKGRTPIVFPILDLQADEIPLEKSTLDKIENLKEINAIEESCSIEFGKNLTIIYGDNGAGKSGIGRLLSNACLSRKPRKLLKNARKASPSGTIPTADFYITDVNGSKIINYKLGDTYQELKAFSVFDYECALIHLNNENKVEFMPSKIKIFDEVFKSVSRIEEKLQEETDGRSYEDPTENVFDGISPITEFIDSLSYETLDKEVDGLLKFTPTDKARLSEKKKDRAKKMKQDVSAQKALLKDECSDLEDYKNLLETKSTTLSKAREKQVNAILKEIKDKKDIADKLSIKNFDFEKFKHIGSSEWKSLILAAQKLHEKETASNAGSEPDYCILCRQGLHEKEKTLFTNYWKFLRSTAEIELATARRTLSHYLEILDSANTNWPVFSPTEVAVKILKKEIPDDLKKIKNSFDDLNIQIQDWIKTAQAEKNVVYKELTIDLSAISKLVTAKKGIESKLVDPTPQINKLNGEIGYLEQKQQASRLIPKIKQYVEWLRWENAVSSINLSSVRGNTTRKKTDIMGEIVISQYVRFFNEETEKLDCNFGLRVESHGENANTIKELKLEFARGFSPSDILSEGEQTVSALADFLTEAKLQKNNSGIIFDDPVTSLDHERRTTIAKRLVEEAKYRQVIVLTHDIVFLLDLQFYAKSESVHQVSVSMRRNGDKVGIIKPELPWIALNVGKKVGYLKNDLIALKTAESGDPDEYRNKVKLWYMLLRETWERAIEERLFKGVIQRFNVVVQTLKLPKVQVTDELIKDITDGMTESSKWLHDMGAGLNPTVPKNAKLTKELDAIENFITKCKSD